MHASLADIVHPILSHALAVRDRVSGGEPVQWDLEQATLKEMLAALAIDDGDHADDVAEVAMELSVEPDHSGQRGLAWATVRYALTCWLDELFTHEPYWRDHPLEASLFGTNLGARKFWEEARYAETRGDLDALEAMHWCVLLGFRGGCRDKAELVQAWATRVGARVDQAAPTWTMPASLEPSLEPVPAGDLPRRKAFAAMLTIALMLPLELVMLWRHWPS